MKVRRYLAADMRTALAEARREQGAEVVILSNRRVAGGIEIITADEYDEALIAAFTPKKETARPREEKGIAAEPPQAGAEPVASGQPAVDLPPAPVEAGKPAPPPVERRQPATGDTVLRETLWTREPVVEQMRAELRSLRGLLQQQFASLAWGTLGATHPLWASLLRKAACLGMNAGLSRELVQQVPETLTHEQAWRRFLALFTKRLAVEGDSLMTQGAAAAFVGPTGVGKTTLIAKLAARFALTHGARTVALITADSQRIAAREQLRSIGRILGIPVRVVGGAEELSLALESVYDRRLILVDTAGLSHRDAKVDEALGVLRECAPLLKTYVVASAATQARDLEQMLIRYAPVRPGAVMLTKLDETQYLAPALSAAILAGLPIAYVSAGQRIPEDCEAARAHALVSRAVAAARDRGDDDNEVDFAMEELFSAGVDRYAGA